jgi:acetyltransferase-like isoleucine patch superfamily enzyme
MENLFSKIRRRETPIYACLYNIAFRFKRLNMPGFVLPVYRGIWALRQGLINALRHIATFFYYEPMFRSRCRRVGKALNYVKVRQGFPYFHGNIHIFLDDNVTVHSRSSFSAANVFEKPSLYIGNKTYLGPGLSIGVAKRISIGSCCYIASNVTISDNDGHPLDPFSRAKGNPVDKKDIFPVKIGNNVWIGEGAIILKGVSIGEGSVVAARSVVVRDIEPNFVVAGNPAKNTKRIQSDEKNQNGSFE